MATLRSNFTHLQEHDVQFLRVGMLAQHYFAADPNTCLVKQRQLAELLSQMAASFAGLLDRPVQRRFELADLIEGDWRPCSAWLSASQIHSLFENTRRGVANEFTPGTRVNHDHEQRNQD